MSPISAVVYLPDLFESFYLMYFDLSKVLDTLDAS